MEPRHRAFERGEQLAWNDVPGFVVLMDADMNKVVERQDGTFSWALIAGGAAYNITTTHQFDIRRKAITYVGVGGGDSIMFLSIVAGHPVQGSVTKTVGGG